MGTSVTVAVGSGVGTAVLLGVRVSVAAGTTPGWGGEVGSPQAKLAAATIKTANDIMRPFLSKSYASY